MLKVKDILAMEYAKQFSVVSGENGLENAVKNVGINDYETLADIPKVFGEGDFLLTSLALYKGENRDIDVYLKAFMDAGAAAIGIKNVYSDELSDEILAYSSRKRIPIIITPKDMYTEDLILFLKNMIRQDQEHSYFELLLEKALDGNLTGREAEKLLAEINPNGNETVYVFYLKKNNENTDVDRDCRILSYKFDELLPHLGIRIAKYQDGMFIFKSRKDQYSDETLEAMICSYGVPIQNYAEGIYDYSTKEKISLRRVLENSLAAAYACACEKKESMNYDEIGVYKYILPIEEEGTLISEYRKRFGCIIAYDSEHDTNLVETALCYVKNHGEIKRTSEDLYQHINTIRYRLKRIRELLGYEPEMYNEFYVDLVLMTKIYKLIENEEALFV